MPRPLRSGWRSAATLEHWRGLCPRSSKREGGTVGGRDRDLPLHAGSAADDPDVVAGKPLHLAEPLARRTAGASSRTVQAYIGGRDGAEPAPAHTPSRWRSGCRRTSSSPSTSKPLVQLSLLHYRPPASLREEDIEIGAGEHRDTRRLHAADAGRHGRPRGGAQGRRVDRRAADPRRLCDQHRRHDDALDQRPLRLDAAPRRQPRPAAALLDPVLRQPGLRRDDRAAAAS